MILSAGVEGSFQVGKSELHPPEAQGGGNEQARTAQHCSRELRALLSEGRQGDAVALAMTTWGAPPDVP